MIAFIRTLTQNRIAWAILLGSTLFLELCGMFFQHVMGLQPCVMCIYQRVAILGIMAGAAIGFINPKIFSSVGVAYCYGPIPLFKVCV